jgi:glycosyltransferase involved in cell wall biosynthesis
MLKVIFCSNTFETTDNGPAKFVQLIITNNINNENVEYFVLTEDTKIESNHIIKLDFYLPKYLRFIGQFYRMLLYARKLRNLDKIHHFDTIIFNNSYQGLFAYFIGFRRQIIGMVNDYGICELKFKKDFFSKPNLYIYGKLERLSIILFPRIIVNSIFLKNKLLQILDVNEKKISVLYKGINTHKELNIKKTLGNPIKVIFVKSDFNTGGLFNLIHALGQIKAFQFVLTIIGPQERFHNLIRQEAEGYKNVILILLGFRYQKETLDQISNSDIFCVPSLKEAFGVANIEAMNLGVSVITSNVGGIPEVVLNNENVWMVSPDNTNELMNAIMECLLNSDIRNSKLQNAFKRSLNFDFKNTLTRLNKIVGNDNY